MTRVLTAFAAPGAILVNVAALPENPVARAAIEGTLAAHAAAGHPIPKAEQAA
jgi:hypothetical protein